MNRRSPAALFLGLLCLWHLGLRLHGLRLPMLSDEGEYAYQARLISDGGTPYKDAYNQKPPLVFFLYRAAYALFGRSDAAPRILALLASWLSILLLYALTPAAWSAPARLAAPAVFAALSTQPIGDFGFPANTEVFAAAFTCAAALAVSRSRDLWGGLAMGAALMTKQTSAWTALVFLGLASKRLRFAAGAAVFPAFVFLYLAGSGAVRDFWDQAYSRNMDYASVVIATSSLRGQLSWFFMTEVPLFLQGGWPALALAAFGLATTRVDTGRRFEILATLWLGSALVGAATGLFLFPHYFLPAVPPLALTAAIGMERLRSGRKAALGVLCLYPALAFFSVYFLDPPMTAARKMLFPNPLYESKTVGAYIREHSKPDERLYVFGSEPQLYVYADRKAATRHDFIFPLTLFPRRLSEIQTELSILESAPPTFIVFVNLPGSTMVASRLGEVFRKGILALLARRYRPAGMVRIRAEGSPSFEPTSDWSVPSLLVFRLRNAARAAGG